MSICQSFLLLFTPHSINGCVHLFPFYAWSVRPDSKVLLYIKTFSYSSIFHFYKLTDFFTFVIISTTTARDAMYILLLVIFSLRIGLILVGYSSSVSPLLDINLMLYKWQRHFIFFEMNWHSFSLLKKFFVKNFLWKHDSHLLLSWKLATIQFNSFQTKKISNWILMDMRHQLPPVE